MQRALISLSALSLAALPALAETRDYPADTFTRLDVSEAIMVVFETGSDTRVTVDQAEGDFSDIQIETRDDTLWIDRKSAGRGWRSNLSTDFDKGILRAKVNGKRVPSYTVRITAPSLAAIDVSRSAMVTASGLASDNLDLAASSSADLSVSGRAGRVDIDASSSADIDAENLEATRLTIDAASSSDVKARAISADQVRISASSSADVELDLQQTGEVYLEASSSADLELSGTCERIELVASSSADIEGRDLTCNSADIKASSGADITLSVTDSVKASASSGGDITIRGNPADRDVRESSGGDISIKS